MCALVLCPLKHSTELDQVGSPEDISYLVHSSPLIFRLLYVLFDFRGSFLLPECTPAPKLSRSSNSISYIQLSKAPEISRKTPITSFSDLLSTQCRRELNALRVDLVDMKPCWSSDKLFVISSPSLFIINVSSTLANVGKRLTGLYDFGSVGSLSFPFSKTTTSASFQHLGKVEFTSHLLYRWGCWSLTIGHAFV